MSIHKFQHNDSKHGIIRSTSLISLGTLSSRILGFIRDIVLARLLGTALRADAFFTAMRISNLFRDMVGEGAINSTVVPVLSEYVEKEDKKELWNFISIVLILSVMILSLITALGIIFAPVIIRVIAPGFIEDTFKLELTIRLTRIMFPYLIFIGLTAYAMGVLYTFRSFLTPAFGPCLLNISLIASAFVALRTKIEPVYALAAGVLVGGVVQLLFQLWPLIRKGMLLTVPKTLAHPGARKIGKLLVPRVFGSAVYQLNVFVDTFCASLSFIIGAGGIPALYYANRIVQFPMGIFVIALTSAVLPTLAGFVARDDLAEMKKMILFSLKNIIVVTVPCSVFLMLFATPLVRIFFERGAFNEYSTAVTSSALLFYALGLMFFGGIKITVTSFHALKDTTTPVRVAGLCLAINIILNFALMVPLKVGGIALASSIAGAVNFLLLMHLLKKRIGEFGEDVSLFFLKVLGASAAMAVMAHWSWYLLGPLGDILRLLCVLAIGFVTFLIGCGVFGVDQIKEILARIVKTK